MYRGLLFVVLYFFILTGFLQAQDFEKPAKPVVSYSPVNIASPRVNKLYIEPPANFNRLKSGEKAKSDIQVSYVNFPENARNAFEYAVSIWESLISTSVPIKVLARWENLEGNILALSRPSAFYLNFAGAPHTDVYYPVALAEKLAGRDINNGEADILCSFNNRYPWYFGTDGNTPSNQYDFVSSVLHELTHGLGIAGFLKNEGEFGYFNTGNNLPGIYDYFVYNKQNQKISDKSLFASPSYELHNQLTSEALKFSQTEGNNGAEKTVNWLYAPSVWKEGASVYHLGLEYDNGLMTPFARLGEAIHDPGVTTVEILSEMGWKSVRFDFAEIKDKEETCASLPVNIKIISDFEIDSASVKMFFSFDNSSEKDSVLLKYDELSKKFCGNIPLDFYLGSIEYHFSVKSQNNEAFRWPAQTPEGNFKFRIGPDFSAPQLVHNPIKIIANSKPEIDMSVAATDNIGIKSVQIEYKLNGVLQEPLKLEKKENNYYTGNLVLNGLTENCDLEYRIIAADQSANQNQKILPSNGFYSVKVFNPAEPVASYSNDFENAMSDFILSDFSISRMPGFANGILHTRHPYPVSVAENEKYNLVAQLRYPVILMENGIMHFDEVVLVEPGIEDSYTEGLVWDYVVVEGSKDNGITWHPVAEEYDSGDVDAWDSTFKSALSNNTSVAAGNQNLSVKRTVYLTNTNEFSAGDTVIFRFRLASDNTVNGWGWAIDNLEIQNLKTGNNNVLANKDLNVYPNPCSADILIDVRGGSFQELMLSDIHGRIIYYSDNIISNKKVHIDLSGEAPGIYFVKTSDGNSSFVKKIIKY